MKTLMKVLLVGSALTSASAYAANSNIKEYYRSGYWTNYAGISDNGTPVCGMSTYGGVKSIHIKYYKERVHVQVFKDTWRIPEDTFLSITIGFNGNTWGTLDKGAVGGMMPQSSIGVVSFVIAPESVSNFLENITAADIMWIRFPDGNEESWSAKMTGSRNSVRSLVGCASQINHQNQPTQPFSNAPPAPPSQPFGNNKKVPSQKIPAKDSSI